MPRRCQKPGSVDFSSESYESFTLFSQLPFELRFQIWELAVLDSARVIYLQQRSTPASRPSSTKAPYRFQDITRALFGSRSISTPTPEPHSQIIAYRTRSPPPAALSACSESRAQAQTFFTLAFGSLCCPPTTYISFTYDALYLSYSFLCAAVKEPSGAFHTDLKDDIRKVKHLMIGGVWEPSSDMPWDIEFVICLIDILAAFKGLETVTLINARHEEDERELQILNPTCPYECWERHGDSKKTTCLRDQSPELAYLQAYGDVMYIQRPPGLD